jgi:hypothetical protein
MLTCSGFGATGACTCVRLCTRRGRLVDKRENERGMRKWAREPMDREILMCAVCHETFRLYLSCYVLVSDGTV